MRNVRRGESTVESVVIAEGLKEGERVVTEGGDRLKDGSHVQLPTDAAVDRPRGGRRQGAGAAAAPDAGGAPANAAALPPAATAAAPGAAAAPAAKLPTPEQRQRMLDAVRNDPAQLERREKFLEALDRGDPAALERWQRMSERPGRQAE